MSTDRGGGGGGLSCGGESIITEGVLMPRNFPSGWKGLGNPATEVCRSLQLLAALHLPDWQMPALLWGGVTAE